MRECWRALGAAWAVAAALGVPEAARAQGAAQPPWTPAGFTLTRLPEQRFEAELAALVEELGPAQFDRVWEHVVDAALQRLDDLPQPAIPGAAPGAPEPPSRDVLALPEPRWRVGGSGSADDDAAGADLTFELGPFEVTLGPVTTEGPLEIARTHGEQAILPGATLRMPWLVP